MSDTTAGPPVDDPDEWTGRRADARRNHDAVLAAAREMFAAHGMEATIPAIAERAGVGKATVYRSYPTKADLVDAVAHEQIGWLEDLVADVGGRDDAFQALSDLLGAVSGRLAEDRLLSQVLSQGSKWRAGAHEGLLERIVTAAKQQGSLRPDATATDIQILVGGFSRVLLDRGDRDPDTWRRYTALVLDALRP